MLITCTNCKGKLRVSEKMLGKRVKCPKCATVLQVPAEPSPDEKEPEAPTTSISTTPMPDASEPTPITPVESEPHEANARETEVTATPPPSMPGKPPPPMTQPSKRGPTFDDDEDDEEEDRRPSKRKRGRDRDDDVDVRRRDLADQPQGVNAFAMTSMILGIFAILSGFGWCCCGPLSLIGVLFAVLAIVFGFLGKTPGSETYAWIGIICGIIAIVIAIAAIAFVLVAVGMDGMMQFDNVIRAGPKR